MKNNMKIQAFNPTKSEIITAVKKVENLTIKNIDDEAGYATVKTAKKTLAGYRTSITKFGKEQRQEAIKWQKEVLRQEKELLFIISPTENKLKGKLEVFDKAKERKEREVLLPTRRKLIDDIEGELNDDEILAMDEKEFAEVYGEMKILYDQEQERKKEAKELEKKRLEDLEKAKKQARAEAKIEAEQEKKEAIANEKRKAKEAKQKIIDEQNKKERERLEAEAEEKRRAEVEAQAEKKRQEILEKDKKFREFLENNGYDKNTDILKPDEKEVELYRIVNTFKK